MTDQQKRLRFLLKAYADNTCTRTEMEELFHFISASKDNTQFSGMLQEVWSDIGEHEKLPAIDNNELFERIREEAAPRIGRPWFSWARVAAILLVTVTAAILYYAITPPQKPLAKNKFNNADIATATHKFINLPDGSTVLLNNNSTLEFPDKFSGNTREVILTGEAYFDIDSDPQRPFIIHTGKVQTKVLGTAFNIRAYPDEEDVTVTVTKGKVRVEMENKTLGIITPNQQISFNKNNSSIVQHAILADSVLTWKENDLVFDNLTFEEAARVIEKQYNVVIQFENDRLKKCRFHASFLNENDVKQVLTVLCDLNKATYRINHNQVMISGEGCD